MLDKAGGNPLWVVEMLRSLSEEGRLRHEGATIEVAAPDLPASLRELVVRRLRYLSEPTLALLRITAVVGDSVSVRDVATVARRPAREVISQLDEAFRAGFLVADGDDVVFRHQLVHDAIYLSVPALVRRVIHRDAAEALAGVGATPAQVADHVIRGADRGDLQAVEWLRRAARDAAAGAPSTSVELLRRAESLLPGGHAEADLVSAELVEALLRAGNVADAAARAEAVLARRHRAETDVPLRLSLISALSVQNRTSDLIERTEAILIDAPDLRGLLIEALDCYEGVGAQGWAARVNAALRQLGVRRGTRGPRSRSTHGWESLRVTERAVSELVAEGLTNREVARRLHISPHTVNTHLRHVYEKLSVSNRAALAAAVSHSIE